MRVGLFRNGQWLWGGYRILLIFLWSLAGGCSVDEESRAGGFEADGFGEAQHKENDESSPYGGIVRFVLEWPEVAEPVFTSDLVYRSNWKERLSV